MQHNHCVETDGHELVGEEEPGEANAYGTNEQAGGDDSVMPYGMHCMSTQPKSDAALVLPHVHMGDSGQLAHNCED